MARAHGARSQMALAFESTYGVPPVSGFTKMPFVSSTVDAQQALQENDLVGYGRDPLAPTQDAIDVDGNLVVPIDAEGFGFWLKAAFGGPVTTGTGPYVHTFSSGGWALPSLSLETGMPEVPSYSMASGLVLDTLSWDISRKGLLTASVELIGQGEETDTASQAGTLDTFDLARFNHFQGAISRNGETLGNIVSGRWNYGNGLERAEVVRGDGLVGGVDPGMAALSGQLVARFDSTVLLTQARDGVPCDLQLAYQMPAAGASLVITTRNVYFSRPRREIAGPSGIQITLDWIASKVATGSIAMCTAVLANERAAY